MKRRPNLFGELMGRNIVLHVSNPVLDYCTFDHLEQVRKFSGKFEDIIKQNGSMYFECVLYLEYTQESTGKVNKCNFHYTSNEKQSFKLTLIDIDSMVDTFAKDDVIVTTAKSKFKLLPAKEVKKLADNGKLIKDKFNIRYEEIENTFDMFS